MNFDELSETEQAFYQFVMEKIQPGKENDARALLSEVLEARNNGTLTKQYMNGVGIRIMALLRFECIADFLKEAQAFAKQFE